MENSGHVVADDDQGTGWLQVKKKHRSGSKFSLQSWVGSFSGKNALRCQHSQCSKVEKGGYLEDKHKCQTPAVQKDAAVLVQDHVVNYYSELNEVEKGKLSSEKSVVVENSVFSSDKPGYCRSVSEQGNPDMVHKIKWGDLEDDAFVLDHENNGRAEIKFGDIGEDALISCLKHDKNQDSVSQACCTSPPENELVAKSLAIDVCPLTNKIKIIEECCEEVDEITTQDVTLLIASGVDSDDKEINAEQTKPTLDENVESMVPSHEGDDIVVKHQVQAVAPEVGESKLSKLQVVNEGSSPVINSPANEQVLSEGSEAVVSGESAIPGCSRGCGGAPGETINSDLPKVQVMGGLGEEDTGESKERFRERLWCFLFENLNRAVDELYLLCELECDLGQMKEAILVLEEAASDFKELTSRVAEFDNVKRSSPRSVDGVPFTMKSDHRRPHALSWEVRRMTTSPHRAEILSSSLEAFKKIQQDRASKRSVDDARTWGLESSDHNFQPGDDLKHPRGASDVKSQQGNLAGRTSRSGIVNHVQNGSKRLHDSAAVKNQKDKVEPGMDNAHPKKHRLAENNAEKYSKSADQPKRQIPPSDKDKEKRNGSSWKSMDAWKEKRNWKDILASPHRVSSRVSYSPGLSRKSAERARILHDKLMSPEKKKKTAMDLKREAEEKHARAMRIRSELENERAQKLQRTSEKLNRVNEWQAVRNLKLREGMYARHQRSESRHEAYIAQVVKRAGDESSKVNEVRFITSLNEGNKKLILRQKLQDSELRRAEKLQLIKTKQKEDMAREEAVLERRKLIEAEKLQRLAETQRRKEEAQVRREEERKASSAAREARALEQQRRKEERAKAQQEEAELLAQKLAERLSESEQRRKYYLEQIRERASTDLRDQSSPFLRRSGNKEGRSTPTNNGEDYQVNTISFSGSSAPSTGNTTLQQSEKRRIKKIRQRLMALKYEFTELPVPSENSGIGYRTAVGTARAKIGRWLQELLKLRQARKEGAASIGLITAEMTRFLDGKEPELQASRQAGLLDFIASALPASHTSKPEACQVTIHFLKLLRVVLSAPANRSYFLAQNLLPPVIPMLSAALENYIKIAASLNLPGGTIMPSSKTSAEYFNSISEVLDGFLWVVTSTIGHASSDERELHMRDGLLELLISYQVIHRLRDLFALYDRPQVEGSPFPSSILLCINLLVVLTSSLENSCSIDWESFPDDLELENGSQIIVVDEMWDSGYSSVSKTPGDCRIPLSMVSGSTITSLPDVPEDRPLDEACKENKDNDSESVSHENERQEIDRSPGVLTTNNDKVSVQVESQKVQIEKDKKMSVEAGREETNESVLSLKTPVAFLLSAISETGLVSLPSLLTAVLLQANNRLSSEQSCYVLPSNFEEVATGVLKVLNNLAILDITFIQRMLARPDLKMEFFHLMSFLISHCTSKWKSAADQVGLLLLESLSLLGYFALFHTENQAVLRWGKSPTILHKVCDLPFVFFSDPDLMPVLAGTLLAACYGCKQNKDVIEQELSMDMLLSLLKSCQNVQRVRSSQALENLPIDGSGEFNQPAAEVRKNQEDISLRSSRQGARSTRAGKGTMSGNSNSRYIKTKNQKDGGKVIKSNEESAPRNNVMAAEVSIMLHTRFPIHFINRAEQFFSAGCGNVADQQSD